MKASTALPLARDLKRQPFWWGSSLYRFPEWKMIGDSHDLRFRVWVNLGSILRTFSAVSAGIGAAIVTIGPLHLVSENHRKPLEIRLV
jgi:hypothetical protein